MRTLLIVLAASLSFNFATAQPAPPLPVPRRTAHIPLAWDASPSTNVTGYRVYHATNSQSYSAIYPVAGRLTTTFTVTNAPPGASNWFVVTAVNGDGLESDPSNVAARTVQSVPAPPGPLQAMPVVVTVRWKPPDAEWVDLTTITNVVLVDVGEHQSAQFSARVDLGPAIPLVRTP